MKHIKLETISLKDHPELNEAWVQEQIAKDPSLLGLGEVVLRDRERRQPKAGRLDLLLQDPETYKRYEVEIQLGATNESHIIRTIEYWDMERKRYPQYDHCAVIIAEDITSRFLNIISLFNGFIPLIAIQIKAVKVEEGIGLTFTKVLDEMVLGMVDEDEETSMVADKEYWLNRGTTKTVEAVDKLIKIIHKFAPDHDLKYNKFYIGLAKDGIANNFVAFKPKKQWLNIDVRLNENPELTSEMEQAGLESGYSKKWGRYWIKLRPNEVEKMSEVLEKTFRMAYEESNS